MFDADDGFLSGVNGGLAARCGFLDAELGQAGFNCLCHASVLFNLLDMSPCALYESVGEAFDVVGSRPRVYYAANAGFILQVQLGVAGNARREAVGRADSFV